MKTLRFAILRIALAAILLAAATVPARAQVTPPEKFLGFKPGADFKLATYEQAIGYMEQLAKETPRLKIFEMGTSSMGRKQKHVVISSEENLGKLDCGRGSEGEPEKGASVNPDTPLMFPIVRTRARSR